MGWLLNRTLGHVETQHMQHLLHGFAVLAAYPRHARTVLLGSDCVLSAHRCMSASLASLLHCTDRQDACTFVLA
jgi:hypothetical protein